MPFHLFFFFFDFVWDNLPTIGHGIYRYIDPKTFLFLTICAVFVGALRDRPSGF